MSTPTLLPQDVGIEKARPLDLFFDLVFVYAVSQITGIIAHPHNGYDYLQAILAGLTIAALYNAFLWLTSNTKFKNHLDVYLMLLAMGGFFVLALSAPTVRGPGGIAFGLATLLLNALHTFMFLRVENSSAQAIREVAPYNLTSALLVFYAAFAPGLWHWGLWIAAIVAYAIPIAKRNSRVYRFSLSPCTSWSGTACWSLSPWAKASWAWAWGPKT